LAGQALIWTGLGLPEGAQQNVDKTSE